MSCTRSGAVRPSMGLVHVGHIKEPEGLQDIYEELRLYLREWACVKFLDSSRHELRVVWIVTRGNLVFACFWK
jgi:hypothetical protein